MKKEITLEERKKVQLEMMDEIDVFCKKNDIRYSLAFGTLLGAIRHKGFIPWDDDVDIMMTLPDLLKMKSLFTSANLSYIDIDNNKCHGYAFSRVANNRSYRREGMIVNSYGIAIDLYVLIGIPENEESFFTNLYPLFNKRIKLKRLRTVLIKILPIKGIPGYCKSQLDYRDYLFNSVPYDEAKKFYAIAGPLNLRHKMIYDRDLFAKLIEVPFEDRKYQAIADWDYYLTLRYGNYMELPPVEQRQPYHGGHFYWK